MPNRFSKKKWAERPSSYWWSHLSRTLNPYAQRLRDYSDFWRKRQASRQKQRIDCFYGPKMRNRATRSTGPILPHRKSVMPTAIQRHAARHIYSRNRKTQRAAPTKPDGCRSCRRAGGFAPPQPICLATARTAALRTLPAARATAVTGTLGTIAVRIAIAT
ncbi:hypothetical protein, partial [Burkholderia stabilis]